nr:FAR1 DNA binding domain, zinc finger, SWIM-type, MULE transposase domain, FHY3/FAR1 family [Tanacetum cinerariifolium]
FEDPDHPDKVYKVVKALYGLHQAHRDWYETLTNYLLENGFQRGKIYQTLFIKRQKGDILLVQIYVDDIIFGSTNKDLCKAFEKLIKDKFQMSSMRELTFFLASTPIDTEKPLLKDPDGEDVDVHTYRSMISSLMYLTSLRPDIMFAPCYGCHQGEPLTSLAVDNGQDTLNEGYFTPIVVGEPLTPLAVHNHKDTIYEGYFTPLNLQDGSFQRKPKGSKFWVPKVNNKLVEGTLSNTLELALKAYKDYAREGGFDVRKGGQKNSKENKEEPNHKLKKTPGGKYIVAKFFEKHNHSLVNEGNMKYLRTSRRLTFSKQQLLNQLSNVNLGPVRSWKVMKEMYDGFENIGATDVECKNYRRGLNEFIGNRNAQMVVDKLLSREEFFEDFSVKYKQGEDTKELVGLF